MPTLATSTPAPAPDSAKPAAMSAAPAPAANGILAAVSASHFINDMMQSLILAMYPLLKGEFALSFIQVGIITLTYQLTASLFQPLIGLYTDRRPQPYSLPFGMLATFCGLLLLAWSPTYAVVLAAAALIGLGSAIFHPESSRIARLASGGRHGLAQSLFQVGGNLGSALGPLLAAAVIVPYGKGSVAWFALAALVGMALLAQVGRWYAQRHVARAQAHSHAGKTGDKTAGKTAGKPAQGGHPRAVVRRALAVLLVLVFSKYFYIAGISSFYTFYLMHKFGLGVRDAQMQLFYFLAASALGTIIGGPVGDRIGRKPVIWMSVLGVAPFALALPYADLFWTTVLAVVIGLVLSSAFSAILVYAQELVPGRVGTISGLFFGFAFGMGGLGAAVLGMLADRAGIDAVYRGIAYLPLLGIVAALLPARQPPGITGRR